MFYGNWDITARDLTLVPIIQLKLLSGHVDFINRQIGEVVKHTWYDMNNALAPYTFVNRYVSP